MFSGIAMANRHLLNVAAGGADTAQAAELAVQDVL
jgi:hypothetical protein